MNESMADNLVGNFGKPVSLEEIGNSASTISQPTIEAAKVSDVALKKPHLLTNFSRNRSPSSTSISSIARISQIEQFMKDNLAFIQDKAKDCHKLNGEIHEKVKENDWLGEEVFRLVALEDARVAGVEDEMKKANFEFVKIRGENLSFAKEFGEAWEYMFYVRGNLPKLSYGTG